MSKRVARRFLQQMLAKRRLTLAEWRMVGEAVRALMTKDKSRRPLRRMLVKRRLTPAEWAETGRRWAKGRNEA